MTWRGPVRRRTRRPGRRQQQRDAQLLVSAVVTAAGIGLVVMVVNWLMAHWWVLVTVMVLAARPKDEVLLGFEDFTARLLDWTLWWNHRAPPGAVAGQDSA